ncbi:MAG TPA: arsinothricin resistance N-acetyltransferase ArsN1 family B [Candidatus Binatia bacterium]|nr:arsinothricin resistance N-acetyltransferase ArsN1 family B [Candidatus Binatia bacterium]
MALWLRAATYEDAGAIASIYAPYVERTVISFEEVAPTAEQIRERMHPAFAWLVACEDDRVVGYAYSSRHRDRASYRWSVDVSVYLDERWHRRGVGRALYASLLEALRTQRFIRAYAGITLPNQASVALHEAMGFARIGVYAAVGYKFGRWRDVGWWGLALGSADGGAEPAEPIAASELMTTPDWQRCIDAGTRLLRV